ncbi:MULTISPECIES: CAP domain-containing protein [unclassified Streptomyces]|uniref:CAP domain-containing protein n=1 Tax=unclassified Streptomyces TaxID=2593676 RepID=UPI001660CCFE|nr:MULTISPECIES: CAP domain-containing protein [unclassified Streptomyces]MBD0711294.1 SCP-like extracellular [Streptomyces sp. CBMA291]MBD0716380.1 SCP-like extracellular [Streptomyces sp. CBMA370]
MGRHRRAGAAPAAEELAAGTRRGHRGARRRRRAPVRTGLLGVSAALAVGAVAVASGLLPGGETLTVGGPSATERPGQSRLAPELTTQGGATQTPTDRAGASAGTGGRTGSASGAGTGAGTGAGAGAAKTASPTATPTVRPTPTAVPSTPAPTKPAAPRTTTAPTTEASAPKPDPAPSTGAPTTKTRGAAPATTDRSAAAEAEVLRLVNVERDRVGCRPVTASTRLASLAGAFSADMAARGFFDHTDPDGDTPWARAEQAGVTGMGGENIARGQADAAAVMASWMNSDGHRANILNCDFTVLGVGVQFGDGGPWWTQDFGY